MFEKMFKLQENKTTLGREVVAGVVTFMTMAYIIFVNPSILSAGMEGYFEALVVATCLAAGIMTIVMGLVTNYPLALASGMGLNAVLTYTVILGMKIPWPTAMGIIFVEGVIISLLVLTNLREWIMDAIPADLKRAIGVGIGLFIAFIGLKNAGLVIGNPATLVSLGPIGLKQIIALLGLLVIIILMARKIRGAILIGIIFSAILAVLFKQIELPEQVFSTIKPEYFRTIFALDIIGALKWGLIIPIFSFLITDFFDTMGTVVAVGEEAGFVTKDGKVPRLKSVLAIDSLAAVVGGLFGCSSVTTYIESAAGVEEGGRTGLTSVVTGLLFLLAIFFTPIALLFKELYITAPALIVVGYLMITVVKSINWNEFTVALPAFLTIIMIPLTYNISNGIGYGFISYVLVKLSGGKIKEVHPLMYIVALAFAIYFITLK